MLTVKLMRHHVTRIVEATHVAIYPAGKAEGSDDNPTLRTNKVRELLVTTHSGSDFCFVIASNPDDVANSHLDLNGEFWHCAYIENAHGATTETVRPY